MNHEELFIKLHDAASAAELVYERRCRSAASNC